MTRIIATLFATTAATLGILGATFAADMTAAEVKAFLSGQTAYLETAAASASGKDAQGVIYYGPLQDAERGYLARQMDDERRSALRGLERAGKK